MESNRRIARPGFTNQVLCQPSDKGSDVTYYVPAYLRMKVKNFTEIDLQSLKAEMNATLIFTVFYGNLPSQIVEQLINRKIVFHFGRDDALLLDDTQLEITLKHKKKQQQFTYTVRKQFKSRIDCDVFWSPFEVVNLVLSITLQSVSFKLKEKGLFGQIKFNLMDHQSRIMKTSYSQEGRFGNYDLAQTLMRAQYSNDRITKEMKEDIQHERVQRQQQKQLRQRKQQKDIEKKVNEGHHKGQILKQNQLMQRRSSIADGIKETATSVLDFSKLILGVNSISSSDHKHRAQDKKVKHFQYAHFTIPVYRLPQSTIVTIFLPLWLLGIINLGIFFQNNDLADRIASLATLMIAFVSLIATIRQQIPPTPKITLVQILVYLETLTSFLGFIESVAIRDVKKFKFVWYKDFLYLISLLITIFTIVSVAVIYTKHKFVWQPSYNSYEDEEEDVKFRIKDWQNAACDQHFGHFLNQVKTLDEYMNLKKQIKEEKSIEKNREQAQNIIGFLTKK